MKPITFEKFLGVILILAAFYWLDLGDWNKIGVFIILSFSGISNILRDAESLFFQKLRDIIQKTALIVSIFLLIKIIFFD